MSHPLLSLVTSCLSLAQKFVQAYASDASLSTSTVSTESPTPSTASETSAKIVTKPREGSPDLHYSDEFALRLAGGVIGLWKPSPELREILTEEDAGQLVRLFAEALQSVTTEAAHLGSWYTTNELLQAQSMLASPEGTEQLHYHALGEGKRVDGLLYLLRDVNKFFLAQAGALNEMIEMEEGDHLRDRLVSMRQTVLSNEVSLQNTIQHVEKGR